MEGKRRSPAEMKFLTCFFPSLEQRSCRLILPKTKKGQQKPPPALSAYSVDFRPAIPNLSGIGHCRKRRVGETCKLEYLYHWVAATVEGR